MKNRILKISVAALLIAVMALSLFSCGTSAVADASDKWESFNWSFSDGTLSITGTGAMPVAKSSDKVSWASVRTGVTKVVFYGDITTVSDYAFYGMQSLTEISLPDTVTSIGKTAFAFCSSLKSIELPGALTSIGANAFEGCAALENIVLPLNVTSVGTRAFAFCRSLKNVIMAGKITSLGDWTFKDCSALEKVVLLDSVDKSKISAKAFEGAKLTSKDISYSKAVSGSVNVTVQYVDEENNVLKKDVENRTFSLGDEYSFTAPNSFEGYTLVGDATRKGTAFNNETITFKYKKNVETEAPVESESTPETEEPETEEKKTSVSTVIALVIFCVVIIGVCVGAVLLIRSDKKLKKNGTTVRKNDGDKKNGKNGKRK